MAGIQTSIQLVDRMTSPLRNIITATNSMVSAFEKAQRDGNSMANIDFSPIREQLNSASEEMKALGDEIDNTKNKQDKLVRGGAGFDNLTGKVVKLVSAYAGFSALKKVIDISDEMSATMARLSNMTNNAQETTELYNDIYASAQRARGSVADMADVVARFGNNAKDAFSSNAEVLRFSEIVQKSMTIAGASTAEASASMLQLSQALGSGVLRGDELNSIFEQAPNLIQYIADYLNVPIGKIREMASQGELTADIVKNAIMSAGDDVDKRFSEMPMTFGQVFQQIQNTALMSFQPVLYRLNELANSDGFAVMVQRITDNLAQLATIATYAFEVILNVGSTMFKVWDALSPVIIAVVTAIILYNTALFAYNTLEAISNGLKILSASMSVAKGTATLAEATATTTATTAQIAFNSALLACPLTWIVLAIIAVITVIILVSRHIAKTGKTATTTFGVITGGINVVIQFFKNLGLQVANIALGIWNSLGAVATNIQTAFGNSIKNVKAFFYDLLGDAVGVVEGICKALNKLPFVDFDYSGISSLAQSYADKAQAERDSKGEYVSVSDAFKNGMNTFDTFQDGWASDAYKSGAEWGDKMSNKFSNMLKKTKISVPNAEALNGSYQNAIANNTKKTANNTAKTAKSLEATSENLKYIKDYATAKAVNRYTNNTITIDFKNNNNITNNSDADGIVKKISNDLLQALQTSMEGVG